MTLGLWCWPSRVCTFPFRLSTAQQGVGALEFGWMSLVVHDLHSSWLSSSSFVRSSQFWVNVFLGSERHGKHNTKKLFLSFRDIPQLSSVSLFLKWMQFDFPFFVSYFSTHMYGDVWKQCHLWFLCFVSFFCESIASILYCFIITVYSN